MKRFSFFHRVGLFVGIVLALSLLMWFASSLVAIGVQRAEAIWLTPTPSPVLSGAALVINEIDYDQPSTDAAEFVELKNISGSAIDLDSYQLELINGSGATAYVTVDLPAFSLPNGDYYVICANTATVVNCDLDISPDTNLIQNGAPDAVALTQAGNIIDTVSYEGDTAAPYTEGSGVGLEDTGVDVGVSISRFPDGIDTDQNNVNLSVRCATPGTTNSSDPCSNTPTPTVPPTITPTPTAGTPTITPTPVQSGAPLVVNEIDYDQTSTDTAEFIELKNVSGSAVELSTYELELVNGSSGAPYTTIALPSFSLAAGDYYVICSNAANVANCDLDVTPDTDLIQNGAPDAVALRLLANDQVMDTVSYEGDTAVPYTEGSGLGLEDSTATASAGISRFPDGVDTHQNNIDLIFSCITPGQPNTDIAIDCANLPTPTPTPSPTPTPTAVPSAIFYISSDAAGTAGSLTFEPEDVILYSQPSNAWGMYFDGSDVGLTDADVDATIRLANGRLIMSFAATTNIPGIGNLTSSDLVMFIPTSLGQNTAGSFVFIFDGSDVGFDTADENIDSLTLTPSGLIALGTSGPFSIAGGVTGEDEDLVAFVPGTFGPNTTGSFQFYFDGSDVGLGQNDNQDVDAAWINLSNTDVYLSFFGDLNPTIANEDVMYCDPSSLGSTTGCLSSGLYWDSSTNGFPTTLNLDALDITFTAMPEVDPIGLDAYLR